MTLDADEKTLARLVDFEDKVACNSELDWVTALANTHAKFVQDISSPTSTRPASLSSRPAPLCISHSSQEVVVVEGSR